MEHSLQIGCSQANLKKVRTFVEHTLCHHYWVPADEADWVVLAIDELCANLMAHAHPHDAAHQIEVRIVTDASGLEFQVRDSQPDGFNLLDYKLPDLQQLVSEKRNGGLGLILVRKIMDDIRAERQNGELVYRMRKYSLAATRQA
jgi:serine/threonine-protein kinase RsbW